MSFRLVTRALASIAASIAVISGLTSPANAQNCDNPEIRRTVILLNNDDPEGEVRSGRIHRFLELPLNHLGYRASYVDSTTAGSDTVPEDTAAILSWFATPDETSSRLSAWRVRAATPCGYSPRQVVLGDLGIRFGEDAVGDALLARLGVRRNGPERAVGHLSTVASADPSVIGYEADVMVGVGAYPQLAAVAPATSRLSVIPQPGAETLDLVVTGPGGGYAHSDALVIDDPRLGTPLWILDPFTFLSDSLSDGIAPVPDTTTRVGRRIFYSTVTPEGWLETEPLRYFGQDAAIGSELLLSTLIAPYPDLPVTVGVLNGDFDPSLAGPNAERGRNAAALVLALPQVTAATSGQDMVHDWVRFAAESGTAGRNATSASLLDGLLLARNGRAREGAVRQYDAAPADASREIGGAIGQLRGLLPESKTGDTFLWIRNSQPTLQAFDEARTAGARTFGGGWQPANPAFPALTGLSPLSARVGDSLQIYDSLGGDAAYTANWTGDLSGFHALRQTLAWTETPRRLTPFQLSYTARAALHFPTQSAVRAHLGLARSDLYAPVAASDYIAMVEGFESVRFEAVGDLSWRVKDRGGLQTIRFPDAAALSLDMEASMGVLGATRTNGALYVSLDPVTAEPVVALSDDPAASGVVLPEGAIAVARSDLAIQGYSVEGCTTGLTATGLAQGYIDGIAGPSETIRVVLPSEELDLTAAADGSFRLDLPGPGATPLTFRTDCGRG